MTKLTFYGAARTVTGSKYLLEVDKSSVLVDCGLFQGNKELRQMNWESPQFNPKYLEAIVLTHAHLDHVGYLPRLVRQGFRGTVYCTPATRQLAELILLDSAYIQEQDAEYANRKGFSKHKPALPLYSTRDAERSLDLFETVDRDRWFSPAHPIAMRYHDAGHLLGSNCIEVEIRNREKPLRIVFSGDVGRYDAPLYFDPTPPPPCDYLICESTYGNRNHPEVDLLDQLEEVALRSIERGGAMLVASFAIGRAQQLIYLLLILMRQKRIPEIPIYLDSPMAIDATEIYRRFAADHDVSESQLSSGHAAFDGRLVSFSQTVESSRKINSVKGPAVIISSSGMMTGGRILHHLRQRLPRPENTILIGGFMAAGTRGRQLVEGEKILRMHGRDVRVRAAVERLNGLSGHAGQNELLRWLTDLPAPQRTFITHGEQNSSETFAQILQDQKQWECVVPELGSSYILGE